MNHQRRTSKNRKGEQGTVMFLTVAMLLTIILPVVGLAIDGGVALAVKAKLQTATDGAALAAARSLARGVNMADQQTQAKNTARQFFDANMNWSWPGVTSPTRTPETYCTTGCDHPLPAGTAPRTIIVRLNTSVNAPTYFMKLMGRDSVTVRAAGAANRRDVNLMMVLDRSNSLDTSGSCDDLRVAASSFVNMFVDGRDRLGLLTFGTTFKADFPPAFNFKSASTSILTRINAIRCAGYTNAAAAYWNGWLQLEPFFNSEPGALNVILFFTDGQPNTVTLDKLDVKSTSACVDKTRKTGVISGSGSVAGLFGWDETRFPPVNDPDYVLAPNSAGCYYASSWNNVGSDIAALHPSDPGNERDKYGNLLTGYMSTSPRDGSNRLRLSATTVLNAGINALDNAAKRLRDMATAEREVYTYAILLGSGGTAEDRRMNRMANTPASDIYDSTKPSGLYVYAANASQLEQAFVQLASDILRISH